MREQEVEKEVEEVRINNIQKVNQNIQEVKGTDKKQHGENKR